MQCAVPGIVHTEQPRKVIWNSEGRGIKKPNFLPVMRIIELNCNLERDGFPPNIIHKLWWKGYGYFLGQHNWDLVERFLYLLCETCCLLNLCNELLLINMPYMTCHFICTLTACWKLEKTSKTKNNTVVMKANLDILFVGKYKYPSLS